MLLWLLFAPVAAVASWVGFASQICPGHDSPCSIRDQSGSGSDSLSTPVQVGQFSGAFSGSISANVGYGSLGVNTDVIVSNFRPTAGTEEIGAFAEAHVDASSSDTLTFVGTLPSTYFMNLRYTLNGSFSSTTPWIQSSLSIVNHICPPELGGTCSSTAFTEIEDSETGFPFAASLVVIASGNTVRLLTDLIANTGVATLTPQQEIQFPTFTVTGSAGAHFGSTLNLLSLLVTDSNGQPVPGLTVSSESGFTYQLDEANLAAVPEPALSVFVGCIALGLVLFKRKRDGVNPEL